METPLGTTLRVSLGRRQTMCVRACICARMCVCVCVTSYNSKNLRKLHSVCSTLFYSTCAISPHPSMVKQAISVFVVEGFHLPWNHRPQLLEFHIVLQLLCCSMGCVSIGDIFVYDTRNRMAGMTCILQREWPIPESPFVWGKMSL